MGVFDSSNEAPGRTECNAKNLRSSSWTFAEKNQEIPPKMVIFGEMVIFGTMKRAKVFSVAITYCPIIHRGQKWRNRGQKKRGHFLQK